MPSLTTSRVVLLFTFLGMILLGRLRFFDKKQLSFIYLCFALSFVNLLVSIYSGGDTTQFSRFVHFALFSLFSAGMYVKLFDDEIQFHKAIVGATLIQVVFVFITYSAPAVNNIIFSYVYVSHNFLSNLGRAPGLSSSGGATLSLIISFGAFSIVRLAIFEKKTWHLPVMLLICFSQVLVGRTGLLLSLVSLFILFYYTKIDLKAFVLTIIGVVVANALLIDFLLSNEQFLEYTLKWAESTFSGDDQTIKTLMSMGIKEMSTMDVILGSGQVSLQNGLNASGSDIGYVQTFYAAGLLGVIFYLVLFSFLYSYYRNVSNSRFFLILLLLPFITELKEPFIFKYMVVFFVFTSLLYGCKNANNR
ncbi:hypothetical protein [Vibrio campbellii]|uniref:hypothetical protein n=1 Tax=Vibrio campbellii TaxID=680 RepID=UPI00215B7EE4|nr:hypothetical protein [Vibrio campbellii]